MARKAKAPQPQTPYDLRARPIPRPSRGPPRAPATPKRTRRLFAPRTPAGASPARHFHPYGAPLEALYAQAFGPADLEEDVLTELADDETVRGGWTESEGGEEGSEDGSASTCKKGEERFDALHDEPVDKLFFMHMFIKTQHEDKPSVWQFCSKQNSQTANVTPCSSASGSSTFVPSSPAYEPDPMKEASFDTGPVPMFFTAQTQSTATAPAMARPVPSEHDYPETVMSGSDYTMDSYETDTIMDDASDTHSDVTMHSTNSFRLSDVGRDDDDASDAGSEDSAWSDDSDDPTYTPGRSSRPSPAKRQKKQKQQRRR